MTKSEDVSMSVSAPARNGPTYSRRSARAQRSRARVCASGQYYLAALDALDQSPVAVRLLRVPFFPKLSKHLIGIAITYVCRCTRRDNHHTHRSPCCQTRC